MARVRVRVDLPSHAHLIQVQDPEGAHCGAVLARHLRAIAAATGKIYLRRL